MLKLFYLHKISIKFVKNEKGICLKMSQFFSGNSADKNLALPVKVCAISQILHIEHTIKAIISNGTFIITIMSINITLVQSGDGSKRDLAINLKDIRNASALQSSIMGRLNAEEDVTDIIYKNVKYHGFEDIPLSQLKTGDSLVLHIDKKIKVDVHMSSATNSNKPYTIECSRMDTTKTLGERISNQLPYNSQAVDMTTNGRYMPSGVSLANQGVTHNSSVHATSRGTGG